MQIHIYPSMQQIVYITLVLQVHLIKMTKTTKVGVKVLIREELRRLLRVELTQLLEQQLIEQLI